MKKVTPNMTSDKAYAALAGSVAGWVVAKLALITFLAELSTPIFEEALAVLLAGAGAWIGAWAKRNFLK